MTAFYSQLFAEAATPQTLDNQKKAPATLSHARTRTKVCAFDMDQAPAVDDTVVLGTFKPGDRILKIEFHHEAVGATTSTIDLGLYEQGYDHEIVAGNVIVADLFADGLDVNSAGSGIDAFDHAALDDFDRGKDLIELAEADGWTNPNGAGEAVFGDWDLVLTVKTLTGTPASTWEGRVIVTYMADG